MITIFFLYAFLEEWWNLKSAPCEELCAEAVVVKLCIKELPGVLLKLPKLRLHLITIKSESKDGTRASVTFKAHQVVQQYKDKFENR